MLFLPHFGFVVFLTITYRCYIVTTCPLCEPVSSFNTNTLKEIQITFMIMSCLNALFTVGTLFTSDCLSSGKFKSRYKGMDLFFFLSFVLVS